MLIEELMERLQKLQRDYPCAEVVVNYAPEVKEGFAGITTISHVNVASTCSATGNCVVIQLLQSDLEELNA